MKIRRANLEQWHDLKNLRIASIEEAPEAFELTLEQARKVSDRHWQALASGDDEVHFFIAHQNEELAGIVGGMSGLCYELVALWVAPNFRECSVASALVKTVINHAIELEHSAISLKVSKDNIAACKLYEKLGFTVTHHIAGNGKRLQELQWTQS